MIIKIFIYNNMLLICYILPYIIVNMIYFFCMLHVVYSWSDKVITYIKGDEKVSVSCYCKIA